MSTTPTTTTTRDKGDSGDVISDRDEEAVAIASNLDGSTADDSSDSNGTSKSDEGTTTTTTATLQHMEEGTEEEEQFHSKEEEEGEMVWIGSGKTSSSNNNSSDVITRDAEVKEEYQPKQTMPQSIVEVNNKIVVIAADTVAKETGRTNVQDTTATMLCNMEEGAKKEIFDSKEEEEEEEEIVWVSASSSNSNTNDGSTPNADAVLLDEEPPLSNNDNKRQYDNQVTPLKKSTKKTLLRPSTTASSSNRESKLFSNTDTTNHNQQHQQHLGDECDQFAFAWAPTWEEDEKKQPEQLPTVPFHDSHGDNYTRGMMQPSTSNTLSNLATANTDSDDFESCRIRLDEQYERALEDREVVFRAQYATVCQSTCLSALVMLLYLAVGCTFYKSHTQWDTTDSLLFTVYSVTTVGYGNHKIPKTVSFQLFTIAYILVGIALLTIMAAQIYEYFVLQATKLRRVELISNTTPREASTTVEDYATSSNMINTFRARFMAELHSQVIDGRPWVERVLDSTWYTIEKTKAFMSETSVGRMLSVFLPFCGLILFGALVVGSIEGWTAVESVYWAVVTLTTVGYGDYYPTKASSTWFCIFYLPSSLFVMSLFLAHVASTYIKFTTAQQIRMESRMRERMKRRREAELAAAASSASIDRNDVSTSSISEISTASANNAGINSKHTKSSKKATEISSETSKKSGEGGFPSPNLALFSLRRKGTAAPTLGFETLPSADEEEDIRSPGNSNGSIFTSESDYIEQRRGLSHREMVLQNSLYSPSSPSRKRRSVAVSKIGEKNMKAIIESVKQSVKQRSSLDDFDSSASTPTGSGAGSRGTRPSFAVRMLVQERLAQIIATDIAGYHSSIEVKDNTLKVKIDSFMRIMQKWLIPRVAHKAFRSVAFHCLLFVGEHDLIVKGSDALLELGPLEFNELFSPLLAAMGNRESMVKWLASTNVLADVELKRSTEVGDTNVGEQQLRVAKQGLELV